MSNLDFPVLCKNIPQRGTKWFKHFFAQLLRAQGWHIEGKIPNVPKAVIIVAPHTSNIDAWFSFLAVLALDLKITILAKHTLFVTPFDKLMHWFGMMPVNRDHPQGLTEHLIKEIATQERIWIAMSPEGTRKQAKQWKSGFYRIAKAAHIPIIMIALDYRHKTIRILGQKTCTDDYQQDMQEILMAYQGNFSAKNPLQLSDPLRLIDVK